jgi:hypothetical protein
MAGDPAATRTLEQAVGEMTVLWNHCQAIVFALFFRCLGARLRKAQTVFFSIRSDAGQRFTTQALLKDDGSDFSDRAWKAIDELGELAGMRNAFIHGIWDFPQESGIATVWMGTGKRLAGKDAILECDKLIANLERLHKTLKDLEEEGRTMTGPAQGQLALEPLALPSRQGAAQAATTVAQAQQQPAAQSLPLQQQPSDRS